MKLSERVESLEQKLELLQQVTQSNVNEIEAVKKDAKIAKSRAAMVVTRLNKIEPQKVEHTLAAINCRADELSDRLALLLHKVTVVSEVSYHAPELAQELVSALENSDDWWRRTSEWTIEDWVGIFEGAHTKPPRVQ